MKVIVSVLAILPDLAREAVVVTEQLLVATPLGVVLVTPEVAGVVEPRHKH
jgi:hypothetical protein